ncbi:antibiotic biosynthesis monooxygenase [Xanthobacter sp. DSM 24535]|uniref:antibiotic biosynthesis monooxygenase family protein n=1 Tax=Roseixanthobacter psychrophilus TaxID=3119917 RepID=UPI0037299713
MYLRIYWSRIIPGSWPSVRERYEQLAQVRVPGRLSRWVTQDVNDPDSIITVTLWESRESVQDWEASPQYERAIAAMQPFLAGSHTVSLCEVKLDQGEGIPSL